MTEKSLSGYYLTRDTDSPGTPERPLSELGAIGYESFWIKNVLRSLLMMLIEGDASHDDLARKQKEVLKERLRVGGVLRYERKTSTA
jgi:uncharacterized membrane protein